MKGRRIVKPKRFSRPVPPKETEPDEAQLNAELSELSALEKAASDTGEDPSAEDALEHVRTVLPSIAILSSFPDHSHLFFSGFEDFLLYKWYCVSYNILPV